MILRLARRERAPIPVKRGKEDVVGMVISRRNENVGIQTIADAIINDEEVVFALKLDYSAVLRLEESLSKLTDTSVSLVWQRGRYVVHSSPYDEIEALEDDDLDGNWISIPPSEVELAVALA